MRIRYFYTLHLGAGQLILARWRKRFWRLTLLQCESTDQIDRVLATLTVTPLPVVIALSDDQAILKIVSFPVAKTFKEIKMELHAKAKHYFGHEANELVIDAEVLKNVNTDKRIVTVRTAAIHRQSLDAILAPLQAQHIPIKMVTLTSLALEKFIKKNLNKKDSATKAVIYIENQHLLFNIFFNYFVYTHCAVFSPASFTNDISRQLQFYQSTHVATNIDRLIMVGNQEVTLQLAKNFQCDFINAKDPQLTISWGLAYSYGD